MAVHVLDYDENVYIDRADYDKYLLAYLHEYETLRDSNGKPRRTFEQYVRARIARGQYMGYTEQMSAFNIDRAELFRHFCTPSVRLPRINPWSDLNWGSTFNNEEQS